MKRQSSASSATTQQHPLNGRRLSILRHAKTEEGHGDDAVRALIPRGESDARSLGVYLKREQLLPDFILCSTAKRARQTLAALDVVIPTQLTQRAYLASPGELLSLIHEADDAVRHLLIIGHNPGLHSLVVSLAGTYAAPEAEELLALKFPTSAYASLRITAPRWKDVAFGCGTLDVFAIGGKV